jgi:DNA-binding NarL/FixJ family response regulator
VSRADPSFEVLAMNVLLIDDHPLILSALELVVKKLDEVVEVTTAASAQAARAALAGRSDFGIALLDLQLGDNDGFDLLAEVRAAHPDLPVVVVSASDRRGDVLRAVELGAMGFVSKRAGNDTLVEALRMVMAGGIYLPPAIMRSSAVADRDDSWDRSPTGPLDPKRTEAVVARLGLTPRQTEVLRLLLQGQSNKLIARALNLSVETIKDHVAAVLRTLKVSSRTQAVLAISELSHPGALGAWRERRHSPSPPP